MGGKLRDWSPARPLQCTPQASSSSSSSKLKCITRAGLGSRCKQANSGRIWGACLLMRVLAPLCTPLSTERAQWRLASLRNRACWSNSSLAERDSSGVARRDRRKGRLANFSTQAQTREWRVMSSSSWPSPAMQIGTEDFLERLMVHEAFARPPTQMLLQYVAPSVWCASSMTPEVEIAGSGRGCISDSIFSPFSTNSRCQHLPQDNNNPRPMNEREKCPI